MVIAYDLNTVQEYVAQAALMGPARPVLIDQFLEDATEVDVDALADGADVVIGGIMEHIEEAGVHSGDSSCVLPPASLAPSVLDRIREYTKRLAQALQVVGLMNVQYAIQRDTVYVLEVNPRASRTVPYVSKATGVPLAKIAARLMTGRKLAEMHLPIVQTNGVAEIAVRAYYAVKSPVFPFSKFRGVDTILGPEMRSRTSGLIDTAGRTHDESPEWMPASSMCSITPPMTTSVPSQSASTSISTASSRN